MENQLFNWYKSRFNAIEEAVPADAWKNIHAQLHPVKKNRKGLFFWLSAGAIILIGSGIYVSSYFSSKNNMQTVELKEDVKSFNNNTSNTDKSEIKAADKKQVGRASLQLDNSDVNIQVVSVENNNNTDAEFKNKESKNLNNADSKALSNKIKASTNKITATTNELNKQEQALGLVNTTSTEANNSATISNNVLLSRNSEISYLSPLNQKIEIENNLPALNLYPFKDLPFSIKNQKPSFFVGVFYERHINFLLNHDFLNYLKSSYKNALQANFGSTYGIIAGRSITNKMQLIGELYWNKSEGQGYMLYQNGAYRSRSILLDYSGLNLLANHAIGKPIYALKKPVVFKYIYGAGFTILKSGNQVEENTTTIKNNFSAFNMSLILGAESEIYFNDNFSLALSLRGYTGLLNINKGNENTPKWFNRTHTANVSLNTGLRYRF